MAELDIKELLLKLENPTEAIELSEQRYKREISTVAGRVLSDDVRIVLLSGPSGSGKTTTANLLCDEIRLLGKKSAVVSLDDFYKDFESPEYPRRDDGKRDIESPFALDIDELHEVMGKIVGGEAFSIPKYDFKVGGRVGYRDYGSFQDGCVILEGIHGLNPIITDTIPSGGVLRLFVSVSTNINSEGVRIISGKKLRFLRRLVRDSIYRGQGALRTLELWQEVLFGEEKHLYPYKELADVKLDTFHMFEPAVMKPYAMRLLSCDEVARDPYAQVVLAALSAIPEIESSAVPEDSLIKEFIPGGIYESLY